MLNEEHVRRVYGVAFVVRNFDCCLTQRSRTSILRFIGVAANDFLAHLDANQPSVAMFITGDFDAVCLHAS
jgi:hypothetical protein